MSETQDKKDDSGASATATKNSESSGGSSKKAAKKTSTSRSASGGSSSSGSSGSSGSSSKSKAEQEWEDRQNELRLQQGLGPNDVPEQRDIRYNDGVSQSAVHDKLVEAKDPRGGELPAHGFKEYQRADSDAQKEKAVKESEGNARYFNGQKGWVNNPGAPDHGRAIGIVRISEYASPQDEIIDSVQGGRGKVKTYECVSRDGRSELLFVSAEHFKPALDPSEWGKTPINTPL